MNGFLPRRYRLTLALATAMMLAGCGDTPVTFQPATLPDAAVDQQYSAQITGFDVGGRPVALRIGLIGSLPPGLTFSSSENGVATIGGTPTAAGSYAFKVNAGGYCTMAGCQRGEKEYTLAVR